MNLSVSTISHAIWLLLDWFEIQVQLALVYTWSHRHQKVYSKMRSCLAVHHWIHQYHGLKIIWIFYIIWVWMFCSFHILFCCWLISVCFSFEFFSIAETLHYPVDNNRDLIEFLKQIDGKTLIKRTYQDFTNTGFGRRMANLIWATVVERKCFIFFLLNFVQYINSRHVRNQGSKAFLKSVETKSELNRIWPKYQLKPISWH